MDKGKVLAVFPEIVEATKQIDINTISLNPDQTGDFSLKINCSSHLIENLKKAIRPILTKDKLTIMQEEDGLTVH